MGMRTQVIFTFIVALLCSVIDGSAQEQKSEKQSSRKEFWEKRNTFIAKEINLTADETSKFIPLENEFQQKKIDIGRECRALNRASREKETLTDAEYLNLIDCDLDARIKELQLEKEYFEKFKQILKPDKLFKYRIADAKFTREVVNMQRSSQSGQRRNQNRKEK
ncbi:MAG: hypothetical protein LBE56_12000 [Tannerella sp.]|jgi:hypothetical protein|nr:hypothetical protein [Tannerella sp.]